MSGAGFTMFMIRSIESNAKLLHRKNVFEQLKSIQARSDSYQHIPMSVQKLERLRIEEKNRVNNSLLIRRIVGVLVVLPISIVLIFGIYILIQALM